MTVEKLTMDKFASQSAQLLAEQFLFAQKSSRSPPRGSVSQNRTNEPVGRPSHRRVLQRRLSKWGRRSSDSARFVFPRDDGYPPVRTKIPKALTSLAILWSGP